MASGLTPIREAVGAVDDQIRFEALVLLVTVHVRELVDLAELLEQGNAPVIEGLHVVGLDGVLVLRRALSSADAHVLDGLQV